MVPLLPRIGVEDLIGPVPDPTTENILGIRNAPVLEFDPELFAELVQFEFIPRCDKGHGHTGFTGPCCPSRTMGVVGKIIGNVQVEDMRQILNIEPASSHIRGDEHLQFVPSELVGHSVPLHLTEVAVEGIGAIGPLTEFIRQFLRIHFGAAEHDAAHIGFRIQKTAKSFRPILGHDQCIFMLDHAVDFIWPAESDLFRIIHEFFYDPLQVWVECGREQPGITGRRRILKNAINVFFESKIQHLIGFVQDHMRQPIQTDRFSFHQVDESPWGGHNELLRFFECPELVLDGSSAIDGEDVQARNILRKGLHLIGDLLAEFACGCQYKRLRVLCGLRFEIGEKWEAKGRCFSRTGLGQSDEIGFFGQ